LVPYSYTHICRLEEAGQFPKRVKHIDYARKNTNYCKVFWVEWEVLDWIQALVNLRDKSTDAPKEPVLLIAPRDS
jgi:predicted DNA-binding transcriptional regulator AlpA